MRRLARLVGLLLGLALAGAAVLAGIEAVLLDAGTSALVVPRTTWARDLRTLQWGNDIFVVVDIGLIVVGVLVAYLALVPRRPVRILVGLPAPGTTWVSRAGLCRRVAHDVVGTPEVDSADVRIRRHNVIVSATLVPGVTAGEGKDVVGRAAAPVLGQLAPEVPLHVRIKVRTTADPVSTTEKPTPAEVAA